jgi:hypothetical protein
MKLNNWIINGSIQENPTTFIKGGGVFEYNIT